VSALDDATRTDVGTDDVIVSDGTASLTSSARLRERRSRAAAEFSEQLNRDIERDDVVLENRQARLADSVASSLRRQREAAQRVALRSKAAEEFGTEPGNIDIERQDGELVATQDLTDDQLRIDQLTGGRFEPVVDAGRNARETAAGPFKPAVEFGKDTRSNALDRLDNLPDVSARDAAALGAAGVVAPEPITSVGGGILAGGALVALGAAELKRRGGQPIEDPTDDVAEIDIPDDPTIDIGEIETPTRRVSVRQSEVDTPSSRQPVSISEIETPEDRQPVRQSEQDVVLEDENNGLRITTGALQGLRQDQRRRQEEDVTDVLSEELDRMEERGEPAVTPGGNLVREEVERVRQEGGGVPSRLYNPREEDFAGLGGAVESEFIDENRDPFEFARSESPTQDDRIDSQSATESPLFDSAFPSLGDSGILPRIGSRAEAQQRSLVGSEASQVEEQVQLDLSESLFDSVSQTSLSSSIEPVNQANTTTTTTTSENIDRLFEDTLNSQSSLPRDRRRFDFDRRDDDSDGGTFEIGFSDRVFATGVADAREVLDSFDGNSSGGSDPFDGIDNAFDPFEGVDDALEPFE